MYHFIKFFENVMKYIRIEFKIIYWKLKYGNRIKFGKNVRFRKRFQINMSKNGTLIIGDGTSFNNDCSINCHKMIIIGNNNMFGENVKIYDHNHIFNDKKLDMKRSYKEREIYIGNENWFGTNSIILSKAKIGNHNVFSANTVINDIFSNDLLVKSKNIIDCEKIVYKEGEKNESATDC